MKTTKLLICILAMLCFNSLKLNAQQGKDMGVGFCSAHGQYTGANCPKCSAATPNTTDGNYNSKKQQAKLEEQRELQAIAIENERIRQLKEAEAQERHEKLMTLYKQIPDAQKLDSKSIPAENGDLKPKTFDGDDGGYMYKGVDVNNTTTAAKNTTTVTGATNEVVKEPIYSSEDEKMIHQMVQLSKTLKWSPDEQSRLDSALRKLTADGDQNADSLKAITAWKNIHTRRQDQEISKAALQGKGPGLPGAGTQGYNDCAIYAIANASGQPYEVVAARATKLVSEGQWRDADDRKNPQTAIENNGLNGGEVAFLAESFGEAEVISNSDFVRVLNEGRPVLVAMIPSDGSMSMGHEVVLTKTFQYKGETWFELIDSNEKGSVQRLYLNNNELNTILLQTGVAYRSDKGSTPTLLHER